MVNKVGLPQHPDSPCPPFSFPFARAEGDTIGDFGRTLRRLQEPCFAIFDFKGSARQISDFKEGLCYQPSCGGIRNGFLLPLRTLNKRRRRA